MIDQLENLQAEFNSLELRLGDPELFQNQPLYLKTMKRYSDLKSVVATFRSYQKVMAVSYTHLTLPTIYSV